MREATDLAISAGIRRELSGRRIDLTKLKFPVKAGVVTLQGELCFVGLEKTADETAVELKFIESSLKKLPGVTEIVFELTNWAKNESGIWESSSGASATAGSSAPMFEGEGIVCPDCDYVIRFCPCCGKPLAGAGRSSAARSRKPALPVKPLIKKKRPVSPLLSPVVRPAMPGTPTVSAPDAVKAFTPSVGQGKPPQPAKTVEPVIPAKISEPVESPVIAKPAPAVPGIPKPATPVKPPVQAAPAASPVPAAPANQATPPIKTAPAVSPARPAPTPAIKPVPASAAPGTPATVSKPVIPSPKSVAPVTVAPPPLQPAKPAHVEELPAEDDIDIPDFSNFALSGSEPNANAADNAGNSNPFADQNTEDLEELAPLPPVAPGRPPRPAAAMTPTQPAPKPAQPAGAPDFNFDSLISGTDDDSLSDSPTGAPQAFDTPAFDLGSLGDFSSTPANSEGPGENLSGFEPPASPVKPVPPAAEEDDTPLPPMRQTTPGRPTAPSPVRPAAKPAAPTKQPPANVFEDDDTPLPPMRPATPPAAKDGKEGKDLFASLFSDTDLNLGLPADNAGQNKNPFGNLDLELDVLEVFPGDDSQAAPPAPAATPGKKPPAPAKPAPADDNPFNLDNVIDLDSPVEEKSPVKKKGSKETKDPFDDFDISKFKL